MIRAALILALALALPGAATAKPPVWIVKKGQATIVLFGSVHLLPPGLDWRPAALTSALSKADRIYFELPMDEAVGAEVTALRTTRGLLPEGDQLSAHLRPGDDARLRRVASLVGEPIDELERMRPWLADMTLSVLVDVRAGAGAFEGVEGQVQNLAPPNAERAAFETAADQIEVLAGATEADQLASLIETLSEIEDRPNSYERVVAEWMSGDLPGLQADALSPLQKASPSTFSRLITDRNRRWMAVISRLLDRPGTTVVIVGMGHLLGPEGLPTLLRREGLKVSGP